MERQHLLRGFILTLAGAILWGFSGTCGQYLFTYKDITPEWITVVRMTAAGIILIIFGISKNKNNFIGILKNRSDMLKLFFFSIIGLMTTQYTYLVTIEATNAGTATVLQYLEPVIVMIYVCLKKRKKPVLIEAAALIFALTGVFLIAAHGKIGSLAISEKGLLWGLLSAMAAAVCAIMPIQLIKKWGSLTITGYAMFIGGLFLLVATRQWNTAVIFDLGTVLCTAVITVIGTALAFTFYLQGISDMGPVKGTITASVEPVAAVIFSALWLGTSFTPADIIAFIFILSAVPMLAARPTP